MALRQSGCSFCARAALVLLVALLVTACRARDPQVVLPTLLPSPTPPPIPTPIPPPDTPAPSPTAAPTATLTPAPTATPPPTSTPTATPTSTPSPPGAFRLLSPADGAIVASASTLLRWSASEQAMTYALVVYASDGALVVSEVYGAEICSSSVCEVSLPGSRLGNGAYMWQVEASNDLGAALSSEAGFVRSHTVLEGLQLGGQVHSTLDRAALMRYSGMTWVKFQVTWTAAAPQAACDLVTAGRAAGFRVLLSVKGPLYPERIDFPGYTAYLQQVAACGPDAIEVWNEMNLYTEWPAGHIDPASYVNDMLAPAYRAIKTASPDTLVITGALASTGVHDGIRVWSDDNYTRGMVRAGAVRYADCIGFHYNAGATSPRATSGHPADPGARHYSWYFKPTSDVYRRAFGGERPLCLTEIGFLSGEGYPPLPPDWLWASSTSVSDQAAWLAESVRYAREMGDIRLLIVWNVDFTGWAANGDPQGGFAIVRPDGSCPACDALHALIP